MSVLHLADHDASVAGEEEDKENKPEATEVRQIFPFMLSENSAI